MDAVTLGNSLKTVKIESRNTEFSQRFCLIQSISPQAARLQIMPNFAGTAVFKKFGKPFVLKTLNHKPEL
jgi:hypothetical protein